MKTRLVLMTALVFAACDGGEDPPPGCSVEANFTSIHTMLSSQTCAQSFCHDSGTMSGGQDYSTGKAAVHATLLEATVNSTGVTMYPNRVVPNASNSSFLWIKVARSDAPSGRMPLGLAPLEQCAIDNIAAWIDGGAPND